MTSDASVLTHTYSPSSHFIYTDNGSLLHVTKIGTITAGLLSSSCLFIPKPYVDSSPISQLAQDGYIITFSSSECLVQDPSTES